VVLSLLMLMPVAGTRLAASESSGGDGSRSNDSPAANTPGASGSSSTGRAGAESADCPGLASTVHSHLQQHLAKQHLTVELTTPAGSCLEAAVADVGGGGDPFRDGGRCAQQQAGASNAAGTAAACALQLAASSALPWLAPPAIPTPHSPAGSQLTASHMAARAVGGSRSPSLLAQLQVTFPACWHADLAAALEAGVQLRLLLLGDGSSRPAADVRIRRMDQLQQQGGGSCPATAALLTWQVAAGQTPQAMTLLVMLAAPPPAGSGSQPAAADHLVAAVPLLLLPAAAAAAACRLFVAMSAAGGGPHGASSHWASLARDLGAALQQPPTTAEGRALLHHLIQYLQVGRLLYAHSLCRPTRRHAALISLHSEMPRCRDALSCPGGEVPTPTSPPPGGVTCRHSRPMAAAPPCWSS